MSLAGDLVVSVEARKPLTALVNDARPIGGIYHLDYDEAIVLTDDFKKDRAGGVPRGGFLLAGAGRQVEGGPFLLDDQELILLRVIGVTSLPNQAELVQARLAVVRDADARSVGYDAVVDPLTRAELQQSAFQCEVVGTFYTDSDSPDAKKHFGRDLENVVSSARYQVFLPSPTTLSWLASYPEPATAADRVVIGNVRFSSTKRKAQLAGTDKANVRVHISDFVGRKTAVFGMTRTGKSNTIKSLVSSVYGYAAETGTSIGQLIFDPQGEYANINEQDKTGLRLLGDADRVQVYRMGADGTDPQIKPLAMNFLDPTNFAAVVDFVNNAVINEYGTYAYVKSFAAIDWDEPDKQNAGDYGTWTKAVLGLYGLLVECGFKGPNFAGSPGIEFQWTGPLFDQFNRDNPGMVTKRGRAYVATTPEAARRVMLMMAREGSWNQRSSGADTPFSFIAKFKGMASGMATIRSLTSFHSTVSTEQVEPQIWRDMEAGRLAIVDLAHGSGDTPKIISEKIVNYLISRANERFRSGLDSIAFQVIVEEAHNLFERGAKDVAGNPWVRLSKEAAKYRIGLIYATQEVSSVDQRILSNTSNWLVAHLNSDVETKELSHYYDFKAWAPSLVKIEDVGFVRMKTHSSPYIVPVQVAKFDHAMVNAARVAAGLDEINFTTVAQEG